MLLRSLEVVVRWESKDSDTEGQESSCAAEAVEEAAREALIGGACSSNALADARGSGERQPP